VLNSSLDQVPQQNKDGSTPSFSDFDPGVIPFQRQLVCDIHAFDYSLGVHECLLSGSLGSAKSLIAAHLAIDHCLRFPKARLLIGRKSMPDLRATIFTKIIEHLEGSITIDGRQFEQGKDYDYSENVCSVWFPNGSQIIARSWGDRRFKKLGSLELSAAVVEELTENDAEDEQALKYLRTRVGRLPHIKNNWIIYCTNPDSPSHFAYDYFQIDKRQRRLPTSDLSKTRHVYFSSTKDNPFLPDWYINQLEADLDPKLARRLIHGEWVELTTDVIYYAYSERNYRDAEYQTKPHRPIYLCFDFNIGYGKPMSMTAHQFIDGKFHFFFESIVQGASTYEQMENIAGLGILDHPCHYIVHGDATGGFKNTVSHTTDYDIIKRFLANYRTRDKNPVDFQIEVPRSNPPVRTRHNIVNSYFLNAKGEHRLYVYKTCQTLHKGFKLTSLKKGGTYIEDDSKEYQHVTSAAGYSIVWCHKSINSSTGMRSEQIR
jgi:PBSX family phage terminase large subunit